MRLIHELSELEKDKIVEALSRDGFQNITLKNHSIDFSAGSESNILRNFSLLSTNVYSRDDLGLRVEFDYQKFLKNNYELKSRHSISLSEAIDRTGSVEEACQKLGWKIIKTKSASNDPDWKADLYSLTIYEVLIGTLVHIIVEQEDECKFEVYAGEMARLWAMGTQNPEDLLSGKEILGLLKKLNNID